jgi:hypothetical protein
MGLYPTGLWPTGLLPTGLWPTGLLPTGLLPTAEQVLWLAGLWLASGPLVIRNSATAKDPPRHTTGRQVETYYHELTLL